MLNSYTPQFHNGFECRFADAYFTFQAETIYESAKIICEKKQDEPFWRFREEKKSSLDADLAESLESYQGKQWLSSDQIKKIPHELVAQALSGASKTDRPLSEIQVLPGDPSNRYTPDIIWNVEPNFFWVIEVKTTRADSAFVPRQRALTSYESALKRRSEAQGISFSLVVVTPTMVFSDISFSQREVDKLVSLHMFGRLLKELAGDQGYIEDDEDSFITEKVLNILKSLEPKVKDYSSELIITPSLMKKWEEKEDECTYPKHYLSKLIESLNEGKPLFPEPPLKITERKSAPHVVKWPLIIRGNPESEIPSSIRQDTLLGRVWTSALKDATTAEHDVDNCFVLIEKKRRFRVSLSLSEEDWLSLATTGLMAKRYKNDSLIKMNKVLSKVEISEDASTDFIDTFLSRASLHDVFDIREQPLITESVDGDCLDLDVLYRSSQSSTIGEHSEVITRIAEELNISRRQLCKKRDFVLKWLPSIGVWLLIRPTNSRKPIFFSILYQNSVDAPGVFRSGEDLGGGWFATRFVSLTSAKLSNLMSASTMWPSLRGMFSLLYESDVSTPSVHSDKLALLTFIMFLENKLCTSKDSLQLRHMYMEMLGHKPQPFKVFSKFHPTIRSSLQLWFRQKMRTIAKSSSLIDDPRSRLLCPVTLKPFRTLEQCLNVMYLGSTYNKFQGETIHGFLKIFNKVIQQEVLLDEPSDARTGLKCGTKAHEFCPSTVKSIGDCIKEQIQKRGRTTVISQVCRDLWETDWDYFATTKASAVKPPADDFNQIDLKSNYRRKCMSAVQDLIKLFPGQRPVEVMGQLIGLCEDEDLNIVNLFRKPQHGGDREIFVLHMVFRVSVFFLERINRTIASFMPGEMLTKPKEKAQIAVDHFKFVLKKMEDDPEKLTVIDSSDASTWCQRFVMTDFGLMMTRYLPTEFHNLIMRVLNLVTSKKLMLPPDLLKLFSKRPLEKSSSEEMNRLKHDFLNGGSLVKKGGIYLKNDSNMMQGILHYTSTLKHWGFRRLNQKMMPLMENIISKQLETEAKIKYSFKVSSDDSSTHKTLSVEGVSFSVKERWLTSMSLAEAKCMNYAGAEHSFQKSATISRVKVEEFNSKWYEGSSTSSIVIKFVLRCLQMPCNGSPVDRQLLLSNLRTALVSEGSGFRLAALVQMSQNELYYRYLGVTTNEQLRENFGRLREMGHPRLGAFVAEPSLCAGMLGYDYALYRRLQTNPTALRHEQWLQEEKIVETLDEENMSSLVFLIGDHKKYESFLRDASFDKAEERKWLNENFEKMYNDDILAKLKLQFFSPSLPLAFKPVDTSETAAMSVYYWSEPVFSCGWLPSQKVSLKEALDSLPESKKELDLISRFPHLLTFQSVDELLESKRSFTKQQSRKKRYVNVMLDAGQLSMSVDKLIRWLWFRDLNGIDSDLAETSWEALRASNPWLKNTYDETKEALKAEDHVQVKMLISSIKNKKRKLLILTPSKKGFSPQMTILNLISQNQDPNNCVVFQNSESEDMFEHFDQIGKGLHDELRVLSMISNGPNADEDVPRYLSRFPLGKTQVEECKRTLPLEVQTYVHLAYWLTHPEIRTNEVKRLRGGFIGGFTVRQKFNGVKFMGRGVFTMNFQDFSCQLIMKDNALEEIRTDHIDYLRTKTKVLTSLMNDMNLTIDSYGDPAHLHWNTRDGVTIRQGVNIVLVKDIPLLQSDHMRVSFKNNVFRLTAFYDNVDERQRREVVLLRSKPRYEFMSYRSPPEELDLSFMDELSESWVRSRTVDAYELDTMIDRSNDGLVKWCVDCIRARRSVTKHSYDDRILSQSSLLLGEDLDIPDGPGDYDLMAMLPIILEADPVKILESYKRHDEEVDERLGDPSDAFEEWKEEEVENNFGFVRRVLFDRSIGLNSLFDDVVNTFDAHEKLIKGLTNPRARAQAEKSMRELPLFDIWILAFPAN